MNGRVKESPGWGSRQWLPSKVNAPPGAASPDPVTVPVRRRQRPPLASSHTVAGNVASNRSSRGVPFKPSSHANVISDTTTTRLNIEIRGRMLPLKAGINQVACSDGAESFRIQQPESMKPLRNHSPRRWRHGSQLFGGKVNGRLGPPCRAEGVMRTPCQWDLLCPVRVHHVEPTGSGA